MRVGPIKLNLQGKIILEEQNKSEIWRAALRAEAKDRMAGGRGQRQNQHELERDQR